MQDTEAAREAAELDELNYGLYGSQARPAPSKGQFDDADKGSDGSSSE
jgi:hypothetical protein